MEIRRTNSLPEGLNVYAKARGLGRLYSHLGEGAYVIDVG